MKSCSDKWGILSLSMKPGKLLNCLFCLSFSLIKPYSRGNSCTVFLCSPCDQESTYHPGSLGGRENLIGWGNRIDETGLAFLLCSLCPWWQSFLLCGKWIKLMWTAQQWKILWLCWCSYQQFVGWGTCSKASLSNQNKSKQTIRYFYCYQHTSNFWIHNWLW